MVSVEVVASTVLGIETTVFAIAVAVYIMLKQGSEFTIADQAVLALVGPKFMADDIAEKITKEVFGWAFLMLFTGAGYLPGMVFGIWGWLTDDMGLVIMGLGWFIGSLFVFIYGVTIERKKWKDKILAGAMQKLEELESKKSQGNTP